VRLQTFVAKSMKRGLQISLPYLKHEAQLFAEETRQGILCGRELDIDARMTRKGHLQQGYQQPPV
jgi:hypothetical protein